METIKPLYLQLSRDDQKAALESLIFAAEEPLTLQNLFNIIVIGSPSIPVRKLDDIMRGKDEETEETIRYAEEAQEKWNFAPEYLEELIAEINHELATTNRPYQILKIANGYQYATRREFGELIHHLDRTRAKRRFSQAAMECLAIIAYRQPITKPEIDQIRGVNSNEVVNSLIDKGVVQPIGQKETIGKPWLFGTTEEFLKIFGINSVEDLPKLRELDEIAAMLEAEKPEMEIVFDVSEDTSLTEQTDIPDPETLISHEQQDEETVDKEDNPGDE